MPRVKRHAETMPTTEVIIEGEPGNTATVAEPESRPPEQNAAQDIIESVAHTTSIPAEPTEPERSHAEQHETRQYQADPTQFEQITLGADNAAPKMRLYRSNRFQQIAIQFDEKPDAQYTEMLREAGYRWRGEDKVWTKQIEREAKWRTHAEGEKLFRAIGNGIRGDLGLEPVAVVSV